MKNPTMIYKPGTMVSLDGTLVDYVTIDGRDKESYIDDGWFKKVSEVADSLAESDAVAPKRGRKPKRESE